MNLLPYFLHAQGANFVRSFGGSSGAKGGIVCVPSLRELAVVCGRSKSIPTAWFRRADVGRLPAPPSVTIQASTVLLQLPSIGVPNTRVAW